MVVLVGGFEGVVAGLVVALVFVAWMLEGRLVTVFCAGFSAGTPEPLGLGALEAVSSFFTGAGSFGGAAVSAGRIASALLSSFGSAVLAGACSDRGSIVA